MRLTSFPRQRLHQLTPELKSKVGELDPMDAYCQSTFGEFPLVALVLQP